MIDIEYDYGVASFFEDDYKDAKAYHKRALQFQHDGQAFSLVFNIASVALERYLVALCELYGEEPLNHNFISLMITVDKLIAVPRELSKEVKSLDQIFGICFLDNYYHGIPTSADAEKTLRLCAEVNNLFDKEKIELVKKSLKQIEVHNN